MTLVRLAPVPPAAAVDLVSLAEARSHCRVEHAEEDALISVYLAAAHQHAEAVLRRAVHPGSYRAVLDRWPADPRQRLDYWPASRSRPLELPSPAGAAVTIDAIDYVDADGAAQVLAPASYQLDPDADPARISPAWETDWPLLRGVAGAVQVGFTAAYVDDHPAPGAIRTAILLMVGHWFVHRESVVTGTITAELPQGVDRLLWPYRLLGFG